MSEPPSLRKTSSFMALFYRMNCPCGLSPPHFNRQYNLDVYEHGFRRHYCGGFVRAGCIACRTGRYSIHPICAQGCFLSHTSGVYSNGLAMAHRGFCVVHFFNCLCRIRANGCQSNFSACANSHCLAHVDAAPHCHTSPITN